MDTKYEVAWFIKHICNWIEYEYLDKKHTSFQYDFNNDKMAWIVNDKAIEKRIQKELYKRLGFCSLVIYTLLPSENTYPNGELRIGLYENLVPANKLYIRLNDGSERSLETLIKEAEENVKIN